MQTESPSSHLPRSAAAGSLIGFALLLAACGEWKPGGADLTARTAVPQAGPDCASCHGYPLSDSNHVYHLFLADSSKTINGTITCQDCHFSALRTHPVALVDSLFGDPDGNLWSAMDFPLDDADGRRIRAFPLARLDTLRQDRPLPAPAREGRVPRFQEYITGLAHMNGVVDVYFAPRVSDTVKWKAQAEWRPEIETCSAVACHGGRKPHWRFAAPAKGLTVLKGETDLP